MQARRATVMVLVEGRNAFSFAMPRSPLRAALSALLVPLLTGAMAERGLHSLRGETGRYASASLSRATSHGSTARHYASTAQVGHAPSMAEVTQPTAAVALEALQPVGVVEDEPRELNLRSPTLAATVALPSAPVMAVKSILTSIARRRGGPTDEDLAAVPTNGVLRLQSLHLGEDLNVRPFDDAFKPNPEALAEIDHVMRCRVTGQELGIDPRLVSVLVQLHGLYGKPIQLVSGHRTVHTIGTKPTSQHTLGRAADIRIPGVGIEELKKVAIKFGARGVGLYPEKGFVHVDVRQKNRYYWIWTAAGGEQPDMGWARPARRDAPASSGGDETQSSATAEAGEDDSEADSDSEQDVEQ